MKKPDIVKLPTSQMEVFLDFFGIPVSPLETIASRILALEEVPQKEWGKIKEGVDTRTAEEVDDDIVLRRMVALGRAEAPPEVPPEPVSLSNERAPHPPKEN